MGRRKRTLITEPALFFVTFSTYERQNIFITDERLEIAQKTLFEVVEAHNVHLLGFVLMPNHIHLLVGINEGGIGLSKFIFSLKGLIRKKLVDDNILWEKRFDDLVINTEEQFIVKLQYIHNNPVKKGLVDSPDKWKYSSYNFWNSDNEHPVLRKEFRFG